MAKQLLGMILASLLSIFAAKSQDLVFDGITPAPGSEISSFDFVLKFDLSKIIEANDADELGIGWTGYHNDKRPEREKSVTIYKGDPSEGIVIGRACSSNYNGGTSGFVPSSDIAIKIDGAIPEAGVTYTMVINNEFKVFSVGNAVPIVNSLFDCFTNPITYTFVGASASADKLSVTACSVDANQSLDVLSEVTFTFSQPVSINSINPLVVKEDDTVFATSIDAVLSEDKTSVTYRFDNISLMLNHAYVIYLPEGAVSSAINSVETNTAFNIPVIGTSVGHFLLSSSIPASGQKTIFSTVEGIFDMPEGFNIYVKPPYTLNLYGYLYKDEVSEVNLVGRLNGEVNSAMNGITWTNTYALEPETTYILNKPAGEFRAYEIATDKNSNDWYNGEVNIILHTPSLAEAGIPKVEFQAPVLGVYDPKGSNITLNNGDKVNEISTIDLLLKDLRYSYNGEYLGIGSYGSKSIELYDVTNGTPVLVKTATLTPQQYETTTYYYTVWRASVNSALFEGHKYKVVIPAGTISVGGGILKNYAANDEYSVEFDGTTPTSVELISCSVGDNAELSELSNIVWKFKGDFVQNTELNVIQWTGSVGSSRPTVVSSLNGETTVRAFFYNTNGGPLQLVPNRTYKIVLPEGLLYYAGDPSIKNEEMTINVIPVEKTPEVVEPEFVNVSIVTNDFMTTIQKAVKGKTFSYAMNFAATDGTAPWEVKSVTMDGKNLNNVNGTYTTLDLTADTELAVEVEYTGNWAVEVSTGVWEIQDSNIQIFKENGQIIVSGATPDKTIFLYTTTGMLVNTATPVEGMDRVHITAASGQTYIVIVDGKAAKIQL